jgi:hypothetical protein
MMYGGLAQKVPLARELLDGEIEQKFIGVVCLQLDNWRKRCIYSRCYHDLYNQHRQNKYERVLGFFLESSFGKFVNGDSQGPVAILLQGLCFCQAFIFMSKHQLYES